MKPFLEQTIRNDMRARYIGWLNTVQWAPGGTEGFPDAIIMPVPFMFRPIEIKRGTVSMGRLYLDRIRPAQVSWHMTLREAGGRSWFLVGAPTAAGFNRYIVEASLAIATRNDGIPLAAQAVQFITVEHKTAKPDQVFTNNLNRATNPFPNY